MIRRLKCETVIYTCVARAHTHTHTMEHYSLFKKNEILPFGTTQVDLKSNAK